MASLLAEGAWCPNWRKEYGVHASGRSTVSLLAEGV
jgi:hypothetical protein